MGSRVGYFGLECSLLQSEEPPLEWFEKVCLTVFDPKLEREKRSKDWRATERNLI